ncbi:hypothetical protein HanXRQr2_Chr17g0814521 [Helianthus annuus]|uniref:Uncharacterized protein n=1 Tax=Helianthus annuus TaxID=4232 RepID=A0A9K3DLG6_HELAN|nr:hypothetical protein HanXRQr2_Chr17g0814521 [Helianthus annuus]
MIFFPFHLCRNSTPTNLGRLQPKGCHLYLRYDRSGRAYLTQSNSGSMKGHVAGL